jgi:hypothetical protein
VDRKLIVVLQGICTSRSQHVVYCALDSRTNAVRVPGKRRPYTHVLLPFIYDVFVCSYIYKRSCDISKALLALSSGCLMAQGLGTPSP